MGFEAEALRLQRQGAAAGERVVERGQLVAVEQLPGARVAGVLRAGAPPALPDLGPRPLQHLFVGGVLPLHEVFDELEQALALQLRRRLRQRRRRVRARLAIRRGRSALELRLTLPEPPLGGPPHLGVRQQHVDVLGRVVDHLREDDRTRRRERPARPPQMQRARVPVPDRLLARRRLVDGVERKGDLDELLAGTHQTPVALSSAVLMLSPHLINTGCLV